MRIEGRAAIVTGGGSGLGEATARMLAENGAKVALLDVSIAKAEAVAKDISGLALECNVADAPSAKMAVERVVSDIGVPRILVNCAGVATAGRIVGKEGPLDLDNFRKVIEINLVGTFNLMRLVADRMQHSEPLDGGERGVIVNTASVAAFDGQIGQAAYASSKGGVAALTLPAARELARFGIRVMTIAPGIFATPMLLGMAKDVQDSLGAMVPWPPRLGQPAEYAALARHIIENQMLNGEVIRLDGAIRMAPK